MTDTFYQEAVKLRAENDRLRRLLQGATETLIWASGRFSSEEDHQLWIQHGKPVVDECLEVINSYR